MDIGKIEYRVRPVTRYVVTRYYESVDGRAGGVETKGEYENAQVAYEVGYALCKAEHERLGLPLDDARIQYPRMEDVFPAQPRPVSMAEAAGCVTPA